MVQLLACLTQGLRVVSRLFADCLPIVCRLFADCLPIVCRLFADRQTVFRAIRPNSDFIGLDFCWPDRLGDCWLCPL